MTGDVIWCHGNDYPVLLNPCLGLTLFFVCVRQESRCYAMEYQPLWLRRHLQPHLVTDPSVQKTTSTTSTLWGCCLSPYASDVPNINSILFNAKHPLLIRCLMWHLCQSVRARGWSQMRVGSRSLCIWVTRQPKPRVIPPQAPRRHLSSTYLKMTYRLVKHDLQISDIHTHSQTVRFCLSNHAFLQKASTSWSVRSVQLVTRSLPLCHSLVWVSPVTPAVQREVWRVQAGVWVTHTDHLVATEVPSSSSVSSLHVRLYFIFVLCADHLMEVYFLF